MPPYLGGTAAVYKEPSAFHARGMSQNMIQDHTGCLQGVSSLPKMTEDIGLDDLASVDKAAPLSPEVQALNAGLKEVANMLLHALPLRKQHRLKFEQGEIHYDIDYWPQ